MIEINLLKTRQEKFYQKVFLLRILFVYFIGFICLLVIAGVSFFSLRIAINSAIAGIENYNQKIKSEQVVIQTLEKHKEEMENLSKALFLGYEEYRKRILWGKRFNIIANAVPENIKLSKIYLSQITQGEINKKVFVIEGFVVQNPQSIRKPITEFMNNIKKNSGTEFSNISLIEIKKEQQNVTFKIECELKG